MSVRIRNTNARLEFVPGATVLVSYDTPVAAIVWNSPANNGQTIVVRTDTWYSVTTSRHINEWLRTSRLHDGGNHRPVHTVPQAYLNALLDYGAHDALNHLTAEQQAALDAAIQTATQAATRQ